MPGCSLPRLEARAAPPLADTQRRLKKRREEEREERKAQPAYERQSMHGQKIAISVGPCSLPENMRTTYSSIPRADTKWK